MADGMVRFTIILYDYWFLRRRPQDADAAKEEHQKSGFAPL